MQFLNTLSYLSVMLIPFMFIATAGLIALFHQPNQSDWRISFFSSWLVVVATLVAIASHIVLASQHALAAQTDNIIRINSLSLLMLFLISMVALVIVRFSRNYIQHEPNENSYQSWLMLALASVTVVITTNHFLIFLLAWVMISIGLHQLLMFYPNRPKAALAAHKKFIISRLADLCMVAAIALLYHTHETFWISDILQHYAGEVSISNAAHFAAVLFALAAILKCAQLPLHGWLMQVMEAPTPVSALLHAGIINMGGFLMILLAPLILKAPAAEWLLMIVGGITAVLASMVMMTRISIKVMLAWSTCAQMGFMLLECGLGLYELALLHLIAHSFYKAYTFLSSGQAVQHYIQDNLVKITHPKNHQRPSLAQWLIGGLLGLLIVIGLFLISNTFKQQPASFVAIACVISITITLLLSENLSADTHHNLLHLLKSAVGIAVLYIAWHSVFGAFFSSAEISLAAAIWMVALFCLHFFNYVMLRYYPHSAYSKRLYLRLFAGFYLDEWTTKITMQLWPAKLPAKAPAKTVTKI